MTELHLCRAVLLIVLVGCATRPPARPSAPSATALDEVATAVAAGVEQQRAPGASVVVMKRDEVLLARGYGVEAVERADSVTPTTVFELGSISKQLTAALILKLAEDRKLSLDDQVSRHLPHFSALPPGLTIRHLLTHTSGMREFFAQPELSGVLGRPGSTTEELETLLSRSPADFAPGSRWSYSSVNYLMLSLIAERVTGLRLADALAARFLRPLGLSSIGQCPPHPGAARGAARGHLPSGGAVVPHPPENFHLFVGAGGLCGNAVDMARWTRALATGKVVSTKSYAQMVAPAQLRDGRTAEYGMAMALVSPDGARRLGHGGYGGGFSAQVAYYPEPELTVVVMLNRFVFAERIERRIARRLLGLPEATVREVALPADQRQRYVGSYDIGVLGWYPRVVEREDKLWLEVAPLPPQPLTFVGNDAFVREAEPYGYRLDFGPDGPGRELRILGMGLMRWYGVQRP